jgi:hypothetical protein
MAAADPVAALAALSVNTKQKPPFRPIGGARKTETVYEEGYSRDASIACTIEDHTEKERNIR